MALSVTNKSAAGSTSNVASYTSASVTANVGDILVCVTGRTATTAGAVTVTGTGLSFTKPVEVLSGSNAAAISGAIVGSAFSGTLGIAFGGTDASGTGASWHIFTIQGADTTTPFVTANTQSASASATSISMTLPSTPITGNQVIGGFMHLANEATVAGTGFTIVGGAGTFGGYITPAAATAAEFGVNGTTVAGSWTTTSTARGVAVEVNQAPAALPHRPVVVNQAIDRSYFF